jgi:solute carrier family 6 (neurotransmitter transporter, glycine) member 5/9
MPENRKSSNLANSELHSLNEKLNKSEDVESNSSKSERERGNWGNSTQFLLSCIAMSVGLGNLWRFPYKAASNGGGAFLIPYFIVLFTIGRPSYYLEMIMGQFSSRSNVKVFDCVPAMRGVGLSQLLSLFLVSSFYATIMAISLRYFFYSFHNPLPWAACDPKWNGSCIDAVSNQTIKDGNPSTQFYFE